MKRSIRVHWVFAVMSMLLMAVCVSTVFAAEKTVIGQVNDNYQIVTDGQVYEIGDSAQGNDLAENHIKAKVKVTGTVEERDGMKIINVVSYTVISE